MCTQVEKHPRSTLPTPAETLFSVAPLLVKMVGNALEIIITDGRMSFLSAIFSQKKCANRRDPALSF